MIYFLFTFVCSVFAYEGLFKMNSEMDVHKAVMAYDRNIELQKSCEFEKLRGGFLWSCFLKNDTKMSEVEMVLDCKVKVNKVKSVQAFPEEHFVRQLPQECQKLISKRRQVLAYKAKGI